MKTRFKGHETFFFREGWLQKALFEIYAKSNTTLFSGNNGIAKLGVGSNMVKSIKYWLLTSNVLEFKNKVYSLSPIGEEIAKEDQYLEDIFSLWVLHINIARNYTNATTWNLFFNQFHAETFKNLDVKNVLKTYLDQHEIDYSDKSVDADVDVLLNMYSKASDSNDPEENFSCPLSRLGLVSRDGNTFTRTTPNLNDIDELVVLYAIICMVGEKKAISIAELENGNNSLVNLFNFNRIIINEYLEQLANQSFIRLEKTAGLDMVYLTYEGKEEDVIRLYFERSNQL